MVRLRILIVLVLSGGFLSTNAQIIRTCAGNGTAGFSGDSGSATVAKINNPYGVAVDAAGNVYFTDYGNNRIRKISTSGIITTIAGTGAATFSGDGGPATAATLQSPRGIAIDPLGNIIFSDYGNNRVRKIDGATGVITTIAGVGGVPSFGGDGGQATAANLGNTWGVAFGQGGDIYLADNLNCRVRKINYAGIISTIAGTGICYISGDGGQATAADVQYPTGVALDGAGNIYIADDGNNRIRKINVTGVISTVTGSPTYGFTGDGGPSTAAKVYYPRAVATDNSGNVYICDMNNFRIRKISSSGVITTIAGSGLGTASGGTGGYGGDGGPATAAVMSHITGVAVHPNGKIYISDNDNNRIRFINTSHIPSFNGGPNQTISVCFNSSINIDTVLAISDIDTGQTETWSVLTGPSHGTLVASYTATSTGGTVIPVGLSYTPFTGYSGSDSFRCVISDGTGSDTTTVHVTVLGLPSAGTISGTSSLCLGLSITFTETVAGGVWICTNTTASVTGSGVVHGSALGTDTVVYTVTSACGSNSTRLILNITLIPTAGTITGPGTVCEGSPVTMTESVSGGTWSVSNPDATITTGGVVSGVALGTDTVIYSVTDACGTASAVRVITISTLPVAGSISGASSVCAGSMITLSAFVSGGTWSSVSPDATVSGGVVTGVSGGLDSIKYTVSNVCGSVFAYKIITINPLPVAGTINGVDSVCPGDSVLFTCTGTSGAWVSSNTSVAQVTVTGWVKGITSGTAIVRYVVSNICGNDTSSFPFYVSTWATCHLAVDNLNGTVKDRMDIYPNPNSGSFTFNYYSVLNEDVRVVVTDVTGRQLKSFTVESNKPTTLDLDQPPGIYFVTAVSPGVHLTSRITILK